MLKTSISYRAMLWAELESRQLKNPRYSLRAYARALGLSPGFLSHLLSGKKCLDPERAKMVAARAGWSAMRQQLFLASVYLDETKAIFDEEPFEAAVSEAAWVQAKKMMIWILQTPGLKEDVTAEGAPDPDSILLASRLVSRLAQHLTAADGFGQTYIHESAGPARASTSLLELRMHLATK